MKLKIGRVKILRGGQPALNVLFHGFRANDKACVEYTYLSTSFSNKNGLLNLYNVNQKNTR